MNKFFFYTTIFLLPTYLLKLPLAELGSLNLLDSLLALSICSGAITLLKDKDPKKPILLAKDTLPFFVLIFLFLLTFFVSFLFNLNQTNIYDNLGVLKSFLVLPIFFAIAAFFLSKAKKLDPQLFLWSFFISASLQSFLGYFFGLFEKLTFDHRLMIFYQSPNEFAMILGPAILVGLFLLLQTKRRRPNNQRIFFLLLGIASLLFSLFLTASLGSWIAVFLSVIFLQLFYQKKHWLFAKKTLIGFVALFAMLLFLLPIIGNYFHYQPGIPANSFDSRMTIYAVSSRLVKENFFWGIGPGNFQQKYLEQQKNFPLFPEWAVPHAHNNILQLQTEGGIFAMITFLSLLLLVLVKTKKATGGFLIIIVYLLIHGSIDTTFWKNDLSVLWWLSVFLSLLSDG